MYTIEKRYINTNSMTVAQAEAYYGKKYLVTDYFTHWWDSPANRAKSPIDIYNYMVKNNKSVRHILGWDDAQKKIRIIAMTPEDRVPLTQQGGNIYGDSVEVDPLIVTSDPRAKELYKALGWLMREREKRWKRNLRPRLHKDVWPTACSDISKARVQQERDKWVNGTYNSNEGEAMKPTKSEVGNAFNYLGIADDKVPAKDYAYYMARREKTLYTKVLAALYDRYKAVRNQVSGLETTNRGLSDANKKLTTENAELKKKLEAAGQSTKVDLGEDTRNWIQKLIDSIRGK